MSIHEDVNKIVESATKNEADSLKQELVKNGRKSEGLKKPDTQLSLFADKNKYNKEISAYNAKTIDVLQDMLNKLIAGHQAIRKKSAYKDDNRRSLVLEPTYAQAATYRDKDNIIDGAKFKIKQDYQKAFQELNGKELKAFDGTKGRVSYSNNTFDIKLLT